MSAPQHDVLDELFISAQRDLPANLEQKLLAIPYTRKLRLVRWVIPTLVALLTPVLWLLGRQQIVDRIDRLQVGLERLIVDTADQLVALATHFAANEPEVMAASVAIVVLFLFASTATAAYINYQGREELYSVAITRRT